MSTQIKDNRWDADPRGERPSDHAAGISTEQAGSNAEATPYRAQDSLNQLVRQGQDASLKSLQVWADLARKRDAGFAASTPMAPFAYDRFMQLLAAQRQIADELVATQHQLMRQPLPPTTPGDSLVSR
ncbi:MAG: hypothetical protein ACRDSH_15180 [Pseudonocardiaceae bacterium]